MFKRTVIILSAILLFPCIRLSANTASITIQLLFPKQTAVKAPALRPLEAPTEISGKIILDIAPYPEEIIKGRYIVEYFLDDQQLFSTSGYYENTPDKLSFSYILDTSKFKNGSYKLIVNFWDEKSQSAIGIKEIRINNKDEQ